MEKIIFNDINIKMNNEQFLFENKINLNKENNIKPKILFRNDTLNNIINGSKNFQSDHKFPENRKLTENRYNYMNKYSIYNNNVNTFIKNYKLKLPSLSEKSIKLNDLLNNKKRVTIKKYEEMYNNYNNNNNNNNNINRDFRKKYIENIMQSCCSVVKMDVPKKKISNSKECLVCYKLKNQSFNYKPIFLYKNNINKNKKKFNVNKYKKLNIFTSDSLYKNNVKIMVNEETMTNSNIRKNVDDNKNNDNDYDYDFKISSKIFNKFNTKNPITNYFHFNTYNDFNSNKYKTTND